MDVYLERKAKRLSVATVEMDEALSSIASMLRSLNGWVSELEEMSCELDAHSVHAEHPEEDESEAEEDVIQLFDSKTGSVVTLPGNDRPKAFFDADDLIGLSLSKDSFYEQAEKGVRDAYPAATEAQLMTWTLQVLQDMNGKLESDLDLTEKYLEYRLRKAPSD